MNDLNARFLELDRPPSAPQGPPRFTGSPVPKKDFPGALHRAQDLAEVFQVVRRAVKSVLGIERAGLSLALANLPTSIGAYWQLTGNVIVMNDTLYQGMRHMVDSREDTNAFVFVVLAHEYLHTLGYWGEPDVRNVTLRVAEAAFGPQHLVTRLAGSDLWERYPFLRMLPEGDGARMRFVKSFDSETTDRYIR